MTTPTDILECNDLGKGAYGIVKVIRYTNYYAEKTFVAYKSDIKKSFKFALWQVYYFSYKAIKPLLRFMSDSETGV